MDRNDLETLRRVFREYDTESYRKRIKRFEEIVEEEFNNFSSKHQKKRRMTLAHDIFDGSWISEIYEAKISRFILPSQTFFRICHPRQTLTEEKSIINYDFTKRVNGALTGTLGREFLPYAEEIYARLAREGIIQPYMREIYLGGSAPELTDSEGDVHILHKVPYLRGSITQTIKF